MSDKPQTQTEDVVRKAQKRQERRQKEKALLDRVVFRDANDETFLVSDLTKEELKKVVVALLHELEDWRAQAYNLGKQRQAVLQEAMPEAGIEVPIWPIAKYDETSRAISLLWENSTGEYEMTMDTVEAIALRKKLEHAIADMKGDKREITVRLREKTQ